jgi:hypothetical protein
MINSEMEGMWKEAIPWNDWDKSHKTSINTRFQALGREADENWVLLGYYAESGANFLPTFRRNLS